MSTLAQELDVQIQKLDPESARQVENLVRGALALAALKAKAPTLERPLEFPLIEGTPGVLINPTKGELNDF